MFWQSTSCKSSILCEMGQSKARGSVSLAPHIHSIPVLYYIDRKKIQKYYLFWGYVDWLFQNLKGNWKESENESKSDKREITSFFFKVTG